MECQPVSQIKPLEQIAELAPSIGQEGMYQTIDRYAAGTTVLYTPGMPLPKDMPGQFITGNCGGLIERIDLSHGKPHLNYSLYGVKKEAEQNLFGAKKEGLKDWNEFHYKPL